MFFSVCDAETVLIWLEVMAKNVKMSGIMYFRVAVGE
jgi:hypothetical protein